MKSNWFVDWFNTKYYHILYKNRDEEEARRFVGNLTTFLKLKKNQKVLDLACGKGRHSITLNELGFDVLGVDLSPNSIAIASKSETEKLKFEVHDMREIIPRKKFDAVFNLFTSFGYFDTIEDNRKVVHAIAEMLNKKGVAVIDFMNAQKVVENLVEKETKKVENIEFHITRSFDGKHIFKHISFLDENQSFSYSERVQGLMLKDFRALFEMENLSLTHTFGNFDLEPFNEKTSERLIMVIQKNG